MGEEIKKPDFKGEAIAYFKGKGLNPGIDRNSFTAKDAIEVFEKAKKALESQQATEATVEQVLKIAWKLFNTLVL